MNDTTATIAPPVSLTVQYAGREVHATQTGTGEPAIVLLTGMGVPAETWRAEPPVDMQEAAMASAPWNDRALLEPELARYTRVISYDRAGMGESDAPGSPRDLDDLAGELLAVLDAAQITRAVLVGHSLGGLIAFTLACQLPQRVAGLVLLDASHPDQFTRFERALPPAAFNVMREGAARLLDVHPERPNLEAILRSGAQVAAPGVLGELPLAVVRRNISDTLEQARESNPAATEESIAAFRATWTDMQAEYAATSTRGELVVAQGSKHYVHFDEPQVALAAIKRVWEAARQQGLPR